MNWNLLIFYLRHIRNIIEQAWNRWLPSARQKHRADLDAVWAADWTWYSPRFTVFSRKIKLRELLTSFTSDLPLTMKLKNQMPAVTPISLEFMDAVDEVCSEVRICISHYRILKVHPLRCFGFLVSAQQSEKTLPLEKSHRYLISTCY